jgi:glycosyltransferase involved in cell wall biosynthesis
VYTAQVSVQDPTTPWDDLSFDDRFGRLTQGSPRAAYYYPTPDTSTFRYRAYNISQSLAAAGHSNPSASWFTERDIDRIGLVLDACDVLVLCRAALYNEKVARIVTQARARRRTILFDVDDLVFDPSYIHLLMDTLGEDMADNGAWDYWFAYVGRVAATLGICDGVLTTNQSLADRATSHSGRPARIIPNYLNREQQRISDRLWTMKEIRQWERDGRIHLGYFSGSPSHVRDFGLVAPVLGKLMDEDPSVWVRIVGFVDIPPALQRHRARIEYLPLLDFISLQQAIGSVEINLVPLLDNTFTDCKSELKWFEAAAVGTLTVASPVQSYRRVINHGRNGWLANPMGWYDTLKHIIEGFDGLRQVIAPRARQEARELYGWDRQAATITSALFESW